MMNNYVLYTNEREKYFILDNISSRSEVRISKSVNNVDEIVNGFKDANIVVRERRKRV